jgi:uncharacterized protein YecA (UPF0149 family)
MTPEELNRTIEFIIESQARLAAAQEQDRHDRLKFEAWAKDLFARMDQRDGQLSRMMDRQTQLLDHQSQRMDRIDKLHENFLRQHQEVLDLQRQALHLLHLILDRLPPPNPN